MGRGIEKLRALTISCPLKRGTSPTAGASTSRWQKLGVNPGFFATVRPTGCEKWA